MMTHRFAELTIVGLLHLAPAAHAQTAPVAPQGLRAYQPVAAVKLTAPPQSFSKLNTVYVPPPTYPVAPAGSYANAYDFGNCTAYVASRIKVPNWGNANMWAINARSQGITVSNIPLVGAIAQTSRGAYGHVAIVEAVGDGTVTVSEMNVEGLNVVDTKTYPTSTFVYIYL